MFDMFHGGKPDPMTLMVVDYEEHRSELNRMVQYIKHTYRPGDEIDLDAVAQECGVGYLNAADIDYIQNQLRRG